MKLKIFEILDFSTVISIEICRPLVAKLKNLKLSKMAFQVVFSAKNVPRFSFGLLEFWSFGVLEFWSFGDLEFWSFGVLEFWSFGV